MPGQGHLDSEGHPLMVDVGKKEESFRTAEAEGWVCLPPSIYEAIDCGHVKKGDVLKIAELAGIMACKRTPDLIPLCHNIRLDSASVRCVLEGERKAVYIRCSVSAREVTGVEMEALLGVAVAALTVYDMCKGIDKGMRIDGIRLLRKSGGKSGDYCVEDIT